MATVTTSSSSGVTSPSSMTSSASHNGAASAEISRLRQLADKLRQEAAELRARLHGERGAVRALRAAHGAAVRKERATERKRRAQLESQLSEVRRTATANGSHSSPGCEHCVRNSKELKKQKDVIKELETKLHKVVDADKLKAADLRAQHEKHIVEIAKITRIHKQDAHQLLEELKTKDRLIGQLRRKVAAPVELVHQGSKKVRDSNRKKNASVASDPKQDDQNTTSEYSTGPQATGRKRRREECGEGRAGDAMSPQDAEVETRRSEEPDSAAPSAEEETDSAVSSAPSSLSPQPCSPTGGDGGGVPFGAWPGRNEHVNDELERALFVKQSVKSGRLRKRLLSLEARESELLRELSDLRDQNELLEFRVLELTNRLDDEDFSSVCHRSPYDTHDMSTDTVDMPIDTGGEPVRRSLIRLARQIYDPQDVCNLLHAAALLDALETLSARQPTDVVDDEFEVKRVSALPPQVSKPDRLVATVSPFRRRADQQEPNDEDEEEEEDEEEVERPSSRRGECCNTSRGTQTDAETATPSAATGARSPPSLDLATEVRKLDRLRESIEQRQQRQLEFYRGRVEILERKLRVYESSGERQARQLAERLGREVRLAAQVEQLAAAVRKLQADNSRLEEERCELEEAENDTRLRCQRLETELEALARSRMAAKRRTRDARSNASHWEQLAGRYEQRNYELEERECELRHRLDVLERTAPALLLFGAWRRMQPDGRNAGGPDVVAAAVNRLTAMPKKTKSPRADAGADDDDADDADPAVSNPTTSDRRCECVCREDTKSPASGPDAEGSGSATSIDTRDLDLVKCVEKLKERELDMRGRILDLERREAAYMETLQQADEIWAQMEGGYKERISGADRTESDLRDRLRRLEERAPADEERVNDLEEAERQLAARVAQLERENTRLRTSADLTESEAAERTAAAEKKAADKTSEAERERRRSRALEDELDRTRSMAGDAGMIHEAEASGLREQLARARNELVHLEVTNGELREEVATLEYRVVELGREAAERAAADEKVARDLTDELIEKTGQMEDMRRALSGQPDSAQAGAPGADKTTTVQPKSGTQSEPCLRLEQAVCELKMCDICSEIVEPDLVDTAEGLTNLCKVVHSGGGLSTASSPPDIQVSPPTPPVCASPLISDTGASMKTQQLLTVPSFRSARVIPKPMPPAACTNNTCGMLNTQPKPSVPLSGKIPMSVPEEVCTNNTCAVRNKKQKSTAPLPGTLSICASTKPPKPVSSAVCTNKTCAVLNKQLKPSVPVPRTPLTSASRSTSKPVSCTKDTYPVLKKQPVSDSKTPSKPCRMDTCAELNNQPDPCIPMVQSQPVPSSQTPSKPCIDDTCPVLQKQSKIDGKSSVRLTQGRSVCPLQTASKPCIDDTCPVLQKQSKVCTSGTPSKTASRPLSAAASKPCIKCTSSAFNKSLDTNVPSTCSATKSPCATPTGATTSIPNVAIRPRYPCRTDSYATPISLTPPSDSSCLECNISSEFNVPDNVAPPCNAIQANMFIRPASSTGPRNFNVRATMTPSGTLEVQTEGPPGVVEHTLAITDSGNLDLVTQFTPDPAPQHRRLNCPPKQRRSPPPRTHRSILELLLDPELSRSEYLSSCRQWWVPQVYVVSERSIQHVSTSAAPEQQSGACLCPRVVPPPPPPPCAMPYPYSPLMIPFAPIPYYMPGPYVPCTGALPSQPPSAPRPDTFDKGAQTSEFSQLSLVEPEETSLLEAALPVVTEPDELPPPLPPRSQY